MIRQFRAGDADTCSRLVRDCLEHDITLDVDLRRHLLGLESPQAMQQRAALFYVAVFETELGVAGLGGVDMNEIRLLYVSPGAQRQGIGRAVLRHLEEMVPAALFPDIFVYSVPSAVGFYQAHGYRSGGEHIIDVGSHRLATVFMRKAL
jgi:ribosomal protein S18 acetylase RimI-like enzyme